MGMAPSETTEPDPTEPTPDEVDHPTGERQAAINQDDDPPA